MATTDKLTPAPELAQLSKYRYPNESADTSGAFSHDYHALTTDGGDDAAYNVFTRRDGTIRHFWGGETSGATADPGQDSRGAPDLMPIWTILDTTPEGRGVDWYPKLD